MSDAAWKRRLAFAMLGICLAATVWIHPALPAVLLLLGGGVAAGLFAPRAAQRFFLTALAVLLSGYALFGRGFAHWGVRPIYPSEVVLVLGLLMLLGNGSFRPAMRSRIAWALVAFGLWGMVRTVGYVGEYGVNALRDAIVWGYAIFAIFLAGALLSTGRFAAVITWYRRLAPWILVVSICVLAASRILRVIPSNPLAAIDIPILDQKPGDLCVHLAGIGAFVLLGLSDSGEPKRGRGRRPAGLLFWSIWLVGFSLAGILTRGGTLAVVIAIAAALIIGRPAGWLRTVWRPAFVGLAAVSVLVIFNLEFRLRDNRPISAEQLIANFTSIAGRTDVASLSETKNWRLNWWGDIVQYTVFGPLFWQGRGYGINLEESDGYKTFAYQESRNPHNVHFTILARSGVPGLTLWIVLLGAFTLSMFRASRFLRANGYQNDSALIVWTWTYWLAFLVNASFDIYLEGPQGGIWFWSVTGFGIALTEHYRSGPLVSLVDHSPPAA